ncbi:hypothetical protein BG006_009751, partial [Podila minutissima]
MVYATRSRSVTASKPAAATARALGETKAAPKMKRSTHQATKGRKKVPVTKPTTRTLKTTVAISPTPLRRTSTTIDPADHHKHIMDGLDHHVTEQDGLDHHHIWYEEFGKNTPRAHTTIDSADHHKHIMDGLDHHVTEQDGLDHHHIWYEEFGKNTPRAHTTIDSADHHKHIKDGQDHHVTEQDGLDHHHIWYKDFGESTPRRPSVTIDIADHHHKHLKDGNDHHVVEQDGRDHHHIWYQDFSENEDNGIRHQQQQQQQLSPSVEGNSASRNARRSSQTGSSQSKTVATRVEPPLTIKVDHAHRKHPLDGKDHHTVEKDGLDHHHIRYPAEDETVTGGHHQGATKAARKSSLAVAHTETSKSHTPIHKVDSSSVVTDHGRTTRSRRYQGSSGTTTTTTSMTTTAHHVLPAESHHKLHTRDEASVRLLAQKSQLDRQAARAAMLSLDGDVLQLQKLLHEKEEALRAAEARAGAQDHEVAVRTETLTREVHELEATIQDLRASLREREKALDKSQSKVVHEQEKISQLHGDLKHEKQLEKRVERQSQHVAKDLEAALAQRDKLAGQVKEMSEKLKSREAELRQSQTAVRGLERTNAAKAKEAQKLSGELGALKKEMSSRQKELKHCHAQIKKLEGSHEQVAALQGQLHGLRGKLAERGSSLKAMLKANKSLVHDSERAEELQEEVKDLQHDIHIREDQLRIAKQAVEDLAGFRDQATTLEVEVLSLRDQLAAEERHETDLEDALMSHENCAFKQQQMQDQIKLLQYELSEKQNEGTTVHSADDAEIHQRDAMVNELHAKIADLQKELADKEGVAQKLKEKSDTEITKLHSNVGTLKIEVLGLRQQLKDKNTELKASEKAAKELEKKVQEGLAKTSKAEKEAKGLKTEIKELELRLATLQGQLATKESTLTRTAEASHKDHDAAEHRLDDMRALIADLRKQIKDTEKETKQEMKAKEDQIAVLKKLVHTWESHEEGWTDTLNKEIEREKTIIHEKEKTLSEATHEIGRLNVAVNQTRTELAQDRKRRASEIEESSKAQLQQAQKLHQQIHSLSDVNEHLEKRVHLEHEHAVHEQQLTNQVQELLQWQQTANEQRKEWETTVKRLEGEREKHMARLTQSEKSIQELQGQLAEAGQWRQKALEQAEKLNGMVSKLEKNQKMLKDLVSKGDKSEIKMKEKADSLEAHIQSLDNDKLRLAKEISIKETLIEELQEKLEDEMAKLGTRLQESKASVSHLNKDVLAKESQIQKMTKGQAVLEARTQELQRVQGHDHHQLEKEHQALLQERALAAEEKRKDEEIISTLRRASQKMEQEFSAMETKLKKEMSTTQELTDKLKTLRKSMMNDSQTELKELDELEDKIKTRSSAVEETIQVTRNRLDSGAFLETSSTTTG